MPEMSFIALLILALIITGMVALFLPFTPWAQKKTNPYLWSGIFTVALIAAFIATWVSKSQHIKLAADREIPVTIIDY